ncbi:dienelactone hydrolase family protein [Pseudorhodoplanes sp.]|uniref:dienelactone hydrolase family protein n=1 Tax=Pseudorhodoplanes sp. TaxID=1934341 RepID=UPI003D0962FE
MSEQQLSVTSKGGQSFDAYIAMPKASPTTKSWPAIVVIHEIFGINNAMRSVAKRFAESGFIVAVPDLFWRIERGVDLGYSDDDRKKAMEFMGKFDLNLGVADIGSAIEAVRRLPECNGKVAVVGFCLGGTLAYLAAAQAKPDAAVSYYGTAIHSHLDKAESSSCPMLLHFAEKDNFVPPEAVAKIKESLNKKATVFTYPDVGHAFTNVDRGGVYDEKSAQLAHSRTQDFLSVLR